MNPSDSGPTGSSADIDKLSNYDSRNETDKGSCVPDMNIYLESQYDVDGDLGPLPPNWEKAFTENGEVYFIDHTTGTSHWLDPRLSKFQKKSLEDCLDDELPYGWEKITDPQYGTYFIDHVNRRTQYENPVLQAKRAVERGLSSRNANKVGRASFTRNPAELCGERFTTSLLKSSRGLGFTIVGGDDDVDEFLQIKSIVPNGPAWLDGKLQTGDLIVFVNEKCVLGYSHNQVVSLFQSIAPGETVCLEVCRGYPLPFDPNDPNTEVVTTVAVDSRTVSNDESSNAYVDPDYDENYENQREKKQALLSVRPSYNYSGDDTDAIKTLDKEESEDRLNDVSTTTISIPIIKGTMGFGFTIADSACGQRVKKILDKQRCKILAEGDILIEINDVNVQKLSHNDVVQVLKNCPYNCEAIIVVQRGHCLNKTTTSAGKNKPRKIENGRLATRDVAGMYRSKTPTADLYSTQQKEVLPSRPKTPLVDTRTRSKTPLADVSASSPSSCQSGGNLNDAINANYGSYPGRIDPASRLLMNREQLEVDSSDYYHYDSCYCYDCKKTRLKPAYGLGTSDIRSEDCDPRERYLDRRKVSPAIKYRDTGQWDGLNPGMRRLGIDTNETIVTLVRQETGFGFRVVGGTEEGSQVHVGHIVPAGAADLDGRICTGDEILSIDGRSVVNSSHHQVVQLMVRAAANGKVKLGIRRRRNTQQLLVPASTYDVVVSRNENEGFGFVIISSTNKAGSTIGRLIEGSPAERCGQLRVGDCIVAVNHIDITNVGHGDIVNLIKDSGYSVTLTIALPVDEVH